MKKSVIFLSVLLLVSAAWGGEYWVQVLAMQKAEMPDTAFQKRLEACSHPYTTVEEEGMHKVRVGSFGSYREALGALMEIRCKVAWDAFIVRRKEPVLRNEAAPDAVAAVNPPIEKTVAEKRATEPPPEVREQEAIAETPKEEAVAEKPCVCICDRHALRKAEITEALSYYRNSPYYRFGTAAPEWSAK